MAKIVSMAYRIHSGVIYLYEISSTGYVDPTEDITDGLRIEFTLASNAFVDNSGNVETSPDEFSVINYDDSYVDAIISYVRARMARDLGDDAKEFKHMREFNINRERAIKTEKPGPDRVLAFSPFSIT